MFRGSITRCSQSLPKMDTRNKRWTSRQFPIKCVKNRFPAKEIEICSNKHHEGDSKVPFKDTTPSPEHIQARVFALYILLLDLPHFLHLYHNKIREAIIAYHSFRAKKKSRTSYIALLQYFMLLEGFILFWG